MTTRSAGLLVALLLLPVCAAQEPGERAGPVPSSTVTAVGEKRAAADRGNPRAPRRAAWLGTRVLPRGPNGYGEIRPTPRILRNRRLRTIDLFPPPSSRRFVSRVAPVPRSVLARSTWSPRCPVTRDELRYVTVSFWGFDHRPHTGELLVHRDAAGALLRVFERLYSAGFPIEEMRVVRRRELSAPPTGDGNNTTAFVCRPARGSNEWSEHAYGRAVDVNPFHNPYVSGDVVLPELASAYANRRWRRPGMVLPDGLVVRAFESIGWSWGGHWTSLKDWMHFSAGGR